MPALAGAGRVVGGRYRLRDPIGRGAMGAVWRARDELLDRDVAVKEVKVSPALSAADRSSLYQRTLREAKTAARLNHPGVVAVYDVVEEDGRPWIVMELVQARSLDRVLAEDGPLPVRDAADVGHQLVSALATAHAAGVLHRDVKPSNVLLAPDGRAVLTDFGIATFEGDEGLTLTGMVMGTPAFTPPERIRGEPATPSSDLWSLGATLYAAVQGRGPYAERGGVITTMNAVLHEDAPAAPSAGRLGPVISALMRKDPAARPDAVRASLLLSGALSPGRPGSMSAGVGEFAVPSAFPAAASPHSGVPLATSWDQPAPLASWDQPAPPASWDQPASAARPWPMGEAAPSYPARGSPGYGAPAADAPYSPAGSPMYAAPVSDAPPYSPAGSPAYSAPVSDAPPYSPAGSPAYSAPVSDTPPYSPAGSPAYSAPVSDTPPYSPAGSPAYSAPVSDAPPYSPAGSPPTVQGQAVAGAAAPGHAGPGRRSRHGRGVAFAACAALAIVAAGVIGGFAVAHGTHSPAAARARGRRDTGHAAAPASPGSATTPASATSPASPGSTAAATLPPGDDWYSRPAASAGTIAGFRLAVPQGWDASTKGLTTYLRDPAGAGFMEVDLTRHNLPGAMAEARWLETKTIRQGKFPGYRRVSIRPVQVLGSTGAVWSFTWQEAGVGRVFAQDYLFGLATGGGTQSYAVYASAPAASWRQTAQMLTEAIRTFRPLT